MTTNAKPMTTDSSHWYYKDGRSCYELPKKDGSGMKVPTLADARKLGLVPSVTTILKVLHKPALVDWMIEQAVLAVLTTPRQDGEADDAFVHRVIHEERVQDQESKIARERGTEIHNAMEMLMNGLVVDSELLAWVDPAAVSVRKYGRTADCEFNIVGNGYAGRVDLEQEDTNGHLWLWDWKTTKKLPTKGAWPEHRLQLSAYAAAVSSATGREVHTGNVYISTVDCGQFVVCEHREWRDTFERGFVPLVAHWQWSTGYVP